MADTSTAIDLSKLPAPTIIEAVDYDAIRAEMVAVTLEVMPEFDATVESDPSMKLIEVFAPVSYTHLIAAAPERDRATPEGQEYAALCVLLDDNLRQMQDVQSVEARNPMKAEFAKAFSPWIEGVLAAGAEGRAAQDKILVQNLVWAIDYRDFAYALRRATHAIRFNRALPERFNRTLPCMLAEDIAELSLAQADLVSHCLLYTSRCV